MTDQERITALEARIAQLEARLALVEQRPSGPPFYGPVLQPAPALQPPYIVTCGSGAIAAVGQVQN